MQVADNSKSERPTTAAFVSLGCAKNVVDSEKMLGLLAEAGVVLTGDESEADVIVVNTCGFLAASRREAHEVIAEAVRRKETGKCRRVVVAGCLVQRDGQRLADEVPGIDALVGVHQRDELVPAVLGRNRTARRPVDLHLGEYHPHTLVDTARLRITPWHYAYLRLGEGCDQKCTFCTIPAIRGPLHCKPPELVLAELRELVADGAREVNIIGQDTTSYGADIGYAAGLAGILREMDRVEGVGWLRLMYAYPSVFSDAMIDAMADAEHVVNYVDLPLQHINDRILKAMHRRVDRRATEGLLERIRRRLPGVHLRTTMIAGFPGETDAEFDELVTFVREQRFSALGVFAYSREPETPAGRMGQQIPEPLKRARADALMSAQQEVAFAAAAEQVGRRFTVLVDGPPENGCQPARHEGQAPEVDGMVRLSGPPQPEGALVAVRCTGHRDYDLTATSVDVPLTVLS